MLERFTAKHVIHAWSNLHTIPNTPLVFRSENAVVALVDIKGFSTLCSKLQLRYKDVGGARIQRAVNPIMNVVIQIATEYHGSIVKFAGDSLIVVFTDDHTGIKIYARDDKSCSDIAPKGYSTLKNLTDATKAYLVNAVLFCVKLQLTMSSGALQEKSSDEWLNNEVGRLQIHTGLGVGDLYHFHVGALFDRMEYFVSGTALLKAGAHLDFAGSNEVALSTTCVDSVSTAFGGALSALCTQERRADCIVLKPKTGLNRTDLSALYQPNENSSAFHSTPDVAEANYDILQAYISKTIVRHLKSGAIESQVNELRECVVVFIRFPQLNAPDKSPMQQSQEAQMAMSIALSALVRWEGALRQLSVDEKGGAMLLTWGLDGSAHEKSDAILALNAALEVRDHLRRQNVDFSIGVSKGFVFSGIIGNSIRSDHTVLGHAVNEAARFMCETHASKNVLVSNSVYNDCMDAFRFGDQMSLKLKGFPDLVCGRLVLSIAAFDKATLHNTADNFNVALRREEVALLEKATSKWLSHQAVRVMVVGESGLGKSALVTHLCNSLSGKTGVSKAPIVSIAVGSEAHKNLAYGAVRTMFLNLFTLLQNEAAHLAEVFDGQSYQISNVVSRSTLEGLGERALFLPPSTRKRKQSFLPGVSVGILRRFGESPRPIGKVTPSETSLNSSRTGRVRTVAASMDSISNDAYSENAKITYTVRSVLRALGEHRSWALLNDVLNTRFVQTDATRFLSGSERRNELFQLLIRIINKVTIIARIPLAFILDDAQFSDQLSYELFVDIGRSCSRVFLAIFTRPGVEYKEPDLKALLKTYMELDGILQINLTSLHMNDTQEFLQGWLEEHNSRSNTKIQTIETRLVEEIHNRSNGNVMVLKLMMNSLDVHLKDSESANHTSRILNVYGGQLQISPSSTIHDVATVFPSSSPFAYVAAQLDRYRPEMKQILRLASVSGQQFSISDINQVLRRIPSNFQYPDDEFEFTQMLQVSDVFGFLVMPDKQETLCCFKHYMIHQGVFSTVPNREEIHHLFAMYYKEVINEENELQLLPALCRHLEHSGGLATTDDMISYNIKLLKLYETTGQVAESLKVHRILTPYLEISTNGGAVNTTMKLWLVANMTRICIYQNRYQEAMTYAATEGRKLGIQLYDKPDLKFMLRFISDLLVASKLTALKESRQKTNAARRYIKKNYSELTNPMMVRDTDVEVPKIDQFETMCEVLELLQALTLASSMEGQQTISFANTVFCLCLSQGLGGDPVRLAKSLALYSMGNVVLGEREKAVKLAKQACQLVADVDSVTAKTAMVWAKASYTFSWSNEWDLAVRYSMNAVEDMNRFQLMPTYDGRELGCIASATLMIMGYFAQAVEVLKMMRSENSTGAITASTTGGLAMQAQMLMQLRGEITDEVHKLHETASAQQDFLLKQTSLGKTLAEEHTGSSHQTESNQLPKVIYRADMAFNNTQTMQSVNFARFHMMAWNPDVHGSSSTICERLIQSCELQLSILDDLVIHSRKIDPLSIWSFSVAYVNLMILASWMVDIFCLETRLTPHKSCLCDQRLARIATGNGRNNSCLGTDQISSSFYSNAVFKIERILLNFQRCQAKAKSKFIQSKYNMLATTGLLMLLRAQRMGDVRKLATALAYLKSHLIECDEPEFTEYMKALVVNCVALFGKVYGAYFPGFHFPSTSTYYEAARTYAAQRNHLWDLRRLQQIGALS